MKIRLNTFHLDEIGNYIKLDPIMLMIDLRLFNAKRKKKEKETEINISVRSNMRLVAHLNLSFCSFCEKQSEVRLKERLDNSGDMNRRKS